MDNVIDLTDDNPTESNPKVVHNISDEEDEDLKLAIALSLQHEEQNSSSQPGSTPKPPEPSTRAPSGLLGLDRKAMEMERLARLKRKRNDAEDGTSSDATQEPTVKRRTSPLPPQVETKPKSSTTAASTLSSRTKPISPPRVSPESAFDFPRGKVLLTSTPSRYSPTSNTLEAVSFPDILRPPPMLDTSTTYTLKSALLSSFITDFDWLFPHFKINGPDAVKFVLILHAQDNRHRQLLQSEFDGLASVKLVMPEISGGGFGTMHSKLMLLFFSSASSAAANDAMSKREICRVVVPSANLIPYDWGVGRVMENILYVIDLPMKTEQQHRAVNMEETLFETNLKQQLSAMGVPADVSRKLTEFDFSATRDIGFVHSISGSQPLSSTPSISNASVPPVATGLLSLSETIASLGLSIPPDSPSYPPKLDFVTSSLGNLSNAFLRQLHQAACGNLDPQTIANTTSKRGGAKSKLGVKEQELDNIVERTLSIYFPSTRTVRNSKGGEPSAGTICFQKKWWEENSLVRNCLRDCLGARSDGILMHSKILYTTFKQPLPVAGANGTTRLCLGWAYIGSANLSESAWGRVTTDAKSKLPKITCRNWESGVVIPVFNDGNNQMTMNENGASQVLFDQLAQPEKEGIMTETFDGCTDVGSNRRLPSSTSGIGASRNKQILQGRKDINEVFAGSVPIPVQVPAPSLVAEGLEPWFFKD